jgi:hypothetical protein
MAIKNPKKQFNFRVEILGSGITMPIFAIQSITLPDRDIEADEHGYGNTVIKTAGLIRLGNAVLSRIEPIDNTDNNVAELSNYFHAWMETAGNAILQVSGTDPAYKRTVLVHETKYDGATRIFTHILYGCWVNKINGKEFKRAESGNLLDTVELCVDYYSTI